MQAIYQERGRGDPRLPMGAGKRERDEELANAQKRARVVDYTSTDNRVPLSAAYKQLAIAQIDFDFPIFYKKE